MNFDINCHLSLPPCESWGANCNFMQLVDLQISCRCTAGYQARKGLHTRTLKIDPHKCFHLKYPYNSYIFKIYQKHFFYAVYKTKKLKTIVLAFFKEKEENSSNMFLITVNENLYFKIWSFFQLPSQKVILYWCLNVLTYW